MTALRPRAPGRSPGAGRRGSTPQRASRLLACALAAAAGVAVAGVGAVHAAVPDCATIPNARAWDGPAAGGAWSTAANWAGDAVPTASEVACLGNAVVDFNTTATVRAVVSGADGGVNGQAGTLTLSPASGEESQLGVLTVGFSFPFLAGPGDLRVTKQFSFPSGRVDGSAGSRLTLVAGIQSAQVGAVSKLLEGRTIVVEPGVTVSDAGGGTSGSGSIENLGTWTLTGDGTVLGGTGTFTNAATGVVRKTAGTGTSTFTATLANAGTIDVQTAGTIMLNGNATSSGTLDAGASGTIATTSGGTQTLGGVVTGTGASRLLVAGPTTISGTLSVPHLEVNGGAATLATGGTVGLPRLTVTGVGTLAGASNVVVSERFDWLSGFVRGPAGSSLTLASTVAANATLASVTTELDGRALVVEPGVTVTHPGGRIGGVNGASVTNRGTWLATGDGTIFQNPSSTFTNAGVVRKTGGSSVSAIQAAVVNTGSIENATTGTLALGGGQPAPGTVSVGNAVPTALTGSGTLSPAVTQLGTAVSPGASPGAIGVLGQPGGWDAQAGSTWRIELGGTGAGQSDRITLPGALSIAAAQTTLELSTLAGYAPRAGDEIVIATFGSRTGTFSTVTGTAIPGGGTWQVVYGPTDVRVRAEGVPGTPELPPLPTAPVVAAVPAQQQVVFDPRTKTFLIRVQYRIKEATLVALCAAGCPAKASISTRSGKRVFVSTAAPGPILLGTKRTAAPVPPGKAVRIDIPIPRRKLLEARFALRGKFLVAETRLTVTLTTPRGKARTIRDGSIAVSVARVKSGALPGLKEILAL